MHVCGVVLVCVLSRTLWQPCIDNIVDEIIDQQLMTSGYYSLNNSPYRPTGSLRIPRSASVTVVGLLKLSRFGT